MAVVLPSFLAKSSPAIPYLMEDSLLRGGYRVAANETERLGIPAPARKNGMLVYQIDTNMIWQWKNNAWEEFIIRASNSREVTYSEPIFIGADSIVRVDPKRILPINPNPGDVITVDGTGNPVWVPGAASASAGTRSTVTYQPVTAINVGERRFFELDLARSALLITVSVDAPDLLVECFSTNARADLNPYTFKSNTSYLEDEGVSELSDGTLMKGRRYAFFVNHDVPASTTSYWAITNHSAIPMTPTLSVTFLTLE